MTKHATEIDPNARVIGTHNITDIGFDEKEGFLIWANGKREAMTRKKAAQTLLATFYAGMKPRWEPMLDDYNKLMKVANGDL